MARNTYARRRTSDLLVHPAQSCVCHNERKSFKRAWRIRGAVRGKCLVAADEFNVAEGQEAAHASNSDYDVPCSVSILRPVS